jgi:hypothetical protein
VVETSITAPLAPAPLATAPGTAAPEPTVTATISAPTAEQPQAPAQEVYAQQLSVVIPNGDTQASVGVPRRASGFGPQSFSTDRQGNTYICDTANRRIQVFSAAGAYQSTLPMQEHAEPNDVTIDDVGSIYVLDATQGTLYQYDQQG